MCDVQQLLGHRKPTQLYAVCGLRTQVNKRNEPDRMATRHLTKEVAMWMKMVLYKVVTCQPPVQAGRLASWQAGKLASWKAGMAKLCKCTSLDTHAIMLVSSKAKECGQQLHIRGKRNVEGCGFVA